ncbi:unannotated protein [freshwater metagenome]|uniref:Unannotated protein n=1 Tax=freshwater metagenome TaxID=449393 RepID=A0A6J6VSZ4_9ZZZZ
MAGAGTGKTKTLAARVSHLLVSGTDPERVLLLTFSRERTNLEICGDAIELFGLVLSEFGLASRGSRIPKSDTVASIYSRVVSQQTPLHYVVHESFPWSDDHVDALREMFIGYDDLLLHWRALLGAPVLRDRVRSMRPLHTSREVGLGVKPALQSTAAVIQPMAATSAMAASMASMPWSASTSVIESGGAIRSTLP